MRAEVSPGKEGVGGAPGREEPMKKAEDQEG